jgi:hypothetical protein
VRRAGRILGGIGVFLGFSLLGWKLIAEWIEPHFLLWLGPKKPFLEVPAVEDTALRLYGDTRPYVGKVASLQKGLVWVRHGRLLVEEGYGFGCPIIEWEGMAYLSQHAEIEITDRGKGTRLTKRYVIDTVDTPIQFLRRKYRRVPSLGEVVFHYDVAPGGVIDIEVDFSGLHVAWTRAYLMNEQGARRFVHYTDSTGRALSGDAIGIWEPSERFIRRGCFEGRDRQLQFCVKAAPPATIYYGRERYEQYNWRGIYYLSWAGVDIELAAPRDVYRYQVILEVQ